ncbi:inorganic phosphate transporter 2-1, chloroplastic [Selaginella moellendorffii]|nr:inorganic phosphate transporter 2-1, chloroplastic [Selaginella moellendorffii]|eukprot:XP_002973893.2 inorganic phosphate transporter 2-1, chloroplastic [Selaginella moellendorffii]
MSQGMPCLRSSNQLYARPAPTHDRIARSHRNLSPGTCRKVLVLESSSSSRDYGGAVVVSISSRRWSCWNGQRIRELVARSSSSLEGELHGSSEAAEEDISLKKPVNGGFQGMAEAFGISPRTATAITLGISVAALVAPSFMRPFLLATTTKAKALTLVTLLCGFYMAWNIGANDVANAMGTSVGSGALTLRQAVLTASILEFAGAFMVGSHVSETMQKILVPGTFAGNDSLLFSGMLSSLAAAGSWLQVASYCGWPVSTTHCIIGSLVGFGLVYGGVNAVYWKSLARVVSSWIISPLLGGLVSYGVYKCIRTFVYSAPHPGVAAARAAPIAVFVGVLAFSVTALPVHGSSLVMAAEAIGLGALGALIINLIIRRQLGGLIGEFCDIPVKESSAGGAPAAASLRKISFTDRIEGPTGTQLQIVYTVFGYLQVLSACFMSFAHGANDVANAIGPISGALAILHGSKAVTAAVSTQVLAWGGFGIVAGLLVWGYRVIATIGNKITELTPTRGFAAEFAAASVVVGASRLGLPISATHTLVGAVMGVGFARGLNSVRGETVREIVASWVVTIPVGALLTVLYTSLFRLLVPSLA